jgi:hypothetical protein
VCKRKKRERKKEELVIEIKEREKKLVTGSTDAFGLGSTDF